MRVVLILVLAGGGLAAAGALIQALPLTPHETGLVSTLAALAIFLFAGKAIASPRSPPGAR